MGQKRMTRDRGFAGPASRLCHPSHLLIGCEVAKRIPTLRGDVLVLCSDTIPTYAVGVVSQDGQQDLRGLANVQYLSDRATALAEAKALARPGKRIFVLDVDRS
jgi:hypothetical protein